MKYVDDAYEELFGYIENDKQKMDEYIRKSSNMISSIEKRVGECENIIAKLKEEVLTYHLIVINLIERVNSISNEPPDSSVHVEFSLRTKSLNKVNVVVLLRSFAGNSPRRIRQFWTFSNEPFAKDRLARSKVFRL